MVTEAIGDIGNIGNFAHKASLVGGVALVKCGMGLEVALGPALGNPAALTRAGLDLL